MTDQELIDLHRRGITATPAIMRDDRGRAARPAAVGPLIGLRLGHRRTARPWREVLFRTREPGER